MKRRAFVGGVTALMLIATSASSAAPSQGTPSTPEAMPTDRPKAEGLVASAARYFAAAGDPSSGIYWVEARIADFETADQAQAVVSDWFSQVEETVRSEYRHDLELSPIAVETVVDTTRAAVGVATDQQEHERQFYVTTLAITDDTRLYTYAAWSEYGDALEELIGVARRTLGIEPLEFAPVPDVDYETGGLWDSLPRIEHMPQGLTWRRDNLPCIGVFGINECSED